MPSNPEAHLIASILHTGDLKTAIAHGISGDMFHTHHDEWKWLETYYARYRKCPSVVAFSGKHPDFRVMRTRDETVFYSDEVKKSHARHLLLGLLDDITNDLAAGDVDTAVRKAGPAIITVASAIGSEADTDIFSDFTDIYSDATARVQRVIDTGGAGVASGFPSIDERLGGWDVGMNILAARLGQGKSWLLQRAAVAAVLNGNTVVFDSLEMTRAQVSFRIHSLLSVAGKALFKTTSLLQGKDYDPVEYRKFLVQLKKTIPGKLHVSDMSRGRVSPLTVAAQIERRQPDLVIVDYLTLMQKSGPDWQGVAQLSSDMQAVGANYGVPILAAAQLNREGEGKGEPPGPEALAGSDAIGQDATLVITTRQRSRSTIQMRAAKNRHGVGGFKWWVRFDPGAGVIEECTYDEAMQLQEEDQDALDAEETGNSLKRKIGRLARG